jgi:hypothetical protein
MSYTFSLQLTVDKEFQTFADILVTGVEGGINYWCDVLAYKWECQPSETFAKLDEHDEEDGQHTITSDTLARAAEVMLAKPDVFFPSAYGNARELALAILTDAGDLDYDAGDADCMIQIGLFGTVVYG